MTCMRRRVSSFASCGLLPQFGFGLPAAWFCSDFVGGGCGFWEWYECDTTTTFLKQLQVDLRDKVWRLSKEIEDLIAATSAARTHVEQMLIQREQSEKKMQVEEEDERKKKDSGRAHKVELLKTLSCSCSPLYRHIGQDENLQGMAL